MVRQAASRMSKIVLQLSRSSERLIDVEYLLLSVYDEPKRRNSTKIPTVYSPRTQG